jgi:hypothetical protein
LFEDLPSAGELTGRDEQPETGGHVTEFLERIEKLCQERFPDSVLAREGMEIPI